MLKLRGPENIGFSGPDKYDTSKEKSRQGGNFQRRLKGALIRLPIAAGLGLGGVQALVENVFADSPVGACVVESYTTDAIPNGGTTGATLKIEVQPPCLPGLSQVTGRLYSRHFLVDGISPTDTDTDLDMQFSSEGGGVYTSLAVRARINTPLSYEGINGLEAEDPFDLVKLVYSDGTVRRVNVLGLFVYNPSILSSVPIQRFSDSIQISPRVVNMREDYLAVAQSLRTINGTQDLFGLTNELYRYGDLYDTLIMTSGQQAFLGPNDCINGRRCVDGATGSSRRIRTPFKGTGLPYNPSPDVAKLFGSQGKLQQLGFVDEIDGVGTILHEFLHKEGARIRGLSDPGDHWLANMSMGGVLGGFEWQKNADGTFTNLGHINGGSNIFSPLEMRNLGLPHPRIEIYKALDLNQNFLNNGEIIHGPFQVITEADIDTDTGGPVILDPDVDPRHVDAGYVFTTKGRLATPEEMWVREQLAIATEQVYSKATGGASIWTFKVPEKPAQPMAILQPAKGQVLNDLNIPLQFQPDGHSRWVQIQLVPANYDGPGANLLIGDPKIMASGQFKIDAPDMVAKKSFLALPGMSYTWRVRVSDAASAPDVNQDQGWSSWAETTFKTPATSSLTFTPVGNGDKTDKLRYPITWTNSNKQIFYDEVQVSGDRRFDPNPETATSFVWWNLVHAGETDNRWITPNLEPNTTYYWRIRPRVQGDGTPVDWSPIYSFSTADKLTQPLIINREAILNSLSGLKFSQGRELVQPEINRGPILDMLYRNYWKDLVTKLAPNLLYE